MARRKSVRALAAAVLTLVVALPLLAPPAHAAPAPAPVKAKVTSTDDDVIVRVDHGSLAAENGALVFRNDAGKTVQTVPLTYIGEDARSYPIDAKVAGGTATLVPSTDVKRSTTTPTSVLDAGRKPAKKVICGPETRKQRDKQALDQLNSELGTAATIGGIAGVIIGAILGIVLSGGPLAIISSPIGALVGAAGGITGAAINGTFARYFGTINSKFKPKTCNI
ncbi:hypothetical protein [Gordonia humi]|uniref:DUF8020 domain-containing protein n=1 Tax=Gordonia humi TaxID=686429 RepID=A0A840EZK8_9ACTN|nr:hypothetical protein [Gordonia humi]MBB4134449.1 hypothetical protein [Gordonia humi]